MYPRFLITFMSLLISGCVALPQFEKISGVTPKTIVDVLECEIIDAKNSNKAKIDTLERLKKQGKLPKDYRIPRRLTDYVALAELNLQVDERATLTPAFTHTDVVSKSLTRVFDWGVKFDTQAQRVYSETLAFTIAGMHDKKDSCKDRPKGISLNGKLGIEEIVAMAYSSIDPDDKAIDYPSSGESTEESNRRGRGGGAKAAFGTSIEFTLLKAITSTGPTWTLANFKGPGKLFSAERSDTHKVTISFALNPQLAAMSNATINSSGQPAAIARKIQMLQQ